MSSGVMVRCRLLPRRTSFVGGGGGREVCELSGGKGIGASHSDCGVAGSGDVGAALDASGTMS